MSISRLPSAIIAPICWSPPKGPLISRLTGKPGILGNNFPGCAGSKEEVFAEGGFIEVDPVQQVCFASIMGDKGNTFLFGDWFGCSSWFQDDQFFLWFGDEFGSGFGDQDHLLKGNNTDSGWMMLGSIV